MLNVNRSIQDAFYRYKMPRLQAKVEGKGNGVKTVIPNMVDIARALGRPPTYPTKFFGCELGAQTQFDHKNDRYIVNGSHEAAKLQDMLDIFIRKFVLCEACDNPETVLKVNNKLGILSASCKACGHLFQLDMRHKLTTFILKNPPEQNLNAQGKSLTERKDKKSKRKQEENENTENEPSNNGNNETFNEEDDDDDNWTVDVSEAAQKERMKELSMGVKSLAVDDDIEKTENDRLNIFFEYVREKLDKGALDVNDEKEILKEAERLEVTNKAPIVLCEVIFGQKILAQIKSHKRLLLRFCHNNTKAQKYLMGGIEKTIESHKETLLPKVAHILKAFYDEDILDEEVIFEWGKKPSKKYVSKEFSAQIHKKAEAFLTWLKEAEEESEDEDEDSEVELEFDDRAKISTIKEKVEPDQNGKSKESTPASLSSKADEADEADDLDIDDI